ncbi:hypothetical protein [Caldanaerobius polysaccharolyticus]|uniref:hypothetical protein n=1 Tax=Caldanaerobius polysaccharolyticus TaxID=44256 RepID=UPI00047ACBA9|nr:hypothetical protein [Caldanaerobius polysaccharolyticus]
MNKIKTNLKSGTIYEIKKYHYTVGGQLFAEIEILNFGDSYGIQGNIIYDNKTIPIGKYLRKTTYDSIEEALNDAIKEVEEKIKNHPWVIQCEEKAKEIGL